MTSSLASPGDPVRAAAPPSERLIVFLVGAVQFVNILDFMMVMPLGPDFARALAISPSHLGFIAGSYTAAAALAGVVGANVLDRFDRRRALAVAMLGLVIGTAAGALAQGLWSLVAARVLAGLFGGPATSLSLSIIADTVPAQRRGRAMGAVMGAFSAASVLGVPAGLNLAERGGWRLPFIAVAALGLVIAFLALRAMPPLRAHLMRAAGTPPRRPRLGALLADGTVRWALAANALVMVAAFSVIPNIAAHLLQNMHYPRNRLDLVYMVGGAVSFLIMRVAGRAIDRAGAAVVAGFGTALFAVVLYLGFIEPMTAHPFHPPVLPIFVGFMAAMSIRNVALTTLSTRVPPPADRAGFMSLQSTAQHLSSAAGAFLSARFLHDGAGGRLEGIDHVALFAMAVALTLPPMLMVIGRRVRAREATAVVRPAELAAG